MGPWQTFVISVGLSLDVFAYCLYKGAMISEIRKVELAKMISLMTVFQTGMMLLGALFTQIPAIHNSYTSVNRLWSFLAALTFLAVAVIMIAKVFHRRHRKIEEQKQDEYNYRIILMWAFLTSIDALIAGIGFGFMGLRLLFTAVVIAAFTALGSIVGIMAGFLLGCGPMNKFVAVGGCLVLIGGVDMMVNYLTAVL